MSKYTRTQITQMSSNETTAIQQINKNFTDIQEAIQDCISRSGQAPSHLTSDLDLNGKRIINAPAPKTDRDFVRRIDVVEDISLVRDLVNSAATASAQAVKAAVGVQDAIADNNVGVVADDLILGDNSSIRRASSNLNVISVVSQDIDTVSSVGNNIEQVKSVAENESNINAVNENKTNIDTCADNIGTILDVSDNMGAVLGVHSNEENINVVKENDAGIRLVAGNIDAILDTPNQAESARAGAESARQSAEAAASSAAVSNPPPLLTHSWEDHILNDIRYLRADTFSWQDGEMYKAAYNHLVEDVDGKTASNSDTIGSYTIYYVLADDGHKIVGPDQESTVQNIYNETGVAWYYILDKTNKRFKLPRENPAREELIQKAGVKSSDYAPTFSYNTKPAYSSSGFTFNSSGSTITSSGSGAPGYPLVGGVEADFSDVVSVDKGHKYLYFYVGNYNKSAIEQTAGLNAELFNGKADVDSVMLKENMQVVSELPAAPVDGTYYFIVTDE